ncbi:MAG: hypothetical protein AAF206_12785, partial [Bacteroidota bacterium]
MKPDFLLYKLLVRSLLGSLLIGLGQTSFAQSNEEPSKFAAYGYVKYLQTSVMGTFPQLLNVNGQLALVDTFGILTNNLVHNRLNFRYYPSDKWTLALETRNRLFFGEQSRDPSFADQIDQYNGLVDLSVRWAENNGFLLHSVIDRAYVKYAHEKWDIRVGRQRINWGINLAWNPNDLFNAYNFFDFDYEERPGNDAIRVQYFPGPLSNIDVAFAPSDTFSQSIGALRYGFNLKGYDLQVLTGYFQGDLSFGGGW